MKASRLTHELYRHGNKSIYEKIGRGQRIKKMTGKSEREKTKHAFQVYY